MTKRSGKKPLTGKEIMRRHMPPYDYARPVQFEFDPKKAYTPEQLSEIGAITLRWNQVEAHIDFIASHIIFNKTPFWMQISVSQKLSNSNKIRLLTEYIEKFKVLDDKSKHCIADCFSQINQCRSYRNAIIHHHIYDHQQGIGSYIDESKSPFQILVSIEALQALYGILCSLLEELREIDLLYRIETDTQTPGRFNNITRKVEKFNVDILRNEIIPGHTKRIEAMQKTRRELQKLPMFPDADLIRDLNKNHADDESSS